MSCLNPYNLGTHGVSVQLHIPSFAPALPRSTVGGQRLRAGAGLFQTYKTIRVVSPCTTTAKDIFFGGHCVFFRCLALPTREAVVAF